MYPGTHFLDFFYFLANISEKKERPCAQSVISQNPLLNLCEACCDTETPVWDFFLWEGGVLLFSCRDVLLL